MSDPQLYSIWHLNLMYSSIEEEHRLSVIEKCFWPLLKLADLGFKVGIEAPAQTLEVADNLDPSWTKKLKEYLRTGKVELIGSGYSQAIGPLLPFSINRMNIEEGRKAYQRLLGAEPAIWMLNEQAFSESLIAEYIQQKIKTLVIDWNSAYGFHPEWNPSWAYSPQNLRDNEGREIQVLWSHSLAFQKFQRRVHKENFPEEYSAYLQQLFSEMDSQPHPSCFCIYGNDAEIFDFRPGRFHTEAALLHQEWPIIESLFGEMRKVGFSFVLPSEALKTSLNPQSLTVTSLQEPVSVKKQPKYNVTRWALTGRNSPRINQWCFDLSCSEWAKEEKPATVCEIWSSDYRTHITEKRWASYFAKVKELHGKWVQKPQSLFQTGKFQFKKAEQMLFYSNSHLEASFNPLRGLSLERLSSKKKEPLAGRIEHGTFSRMDMSADWFSSNTVLEIPGQAQATDLKKVQVHQEKNMVACEIPFQKGKIGKLFTFHPEEASWTLEYYFDQVELPIGSLRLGFLSFLDGLKDPSSLRIFTHLGGKELQKFSFPKEDFDHGAKSTSLVSAQQALGWTENKIIVETENYKLSVELEASTLRPLPMLEKKTCPEGSLIRIYFSLSECDETRKSNWTLSEDFVRFRYRLEEKGHET